MGIQGLHSHLKSISNDKHVREFRGKRMGIDMYVWLHNSISSCAELLAHNKPTDRYVNVHTFSHTKTMFYMDHCVILCIIICM